MWRYFPIFKLFINVPISLRLSNDWLLKAGEIWSSLLSLKRLFYNYSTPCKLCNIDLSLLRSVYLSMNASCRVLGRNSGNYIHGWSQSHVGWQNDVDICVDGFRLNLANRLKKMPQTSQTTCRHRCADCRAFNCTLKCVLKSVPAPWKAVCVKS